MAITFPSDITTILASDEKAPVHLFELTLTLATLRYACARAAIQFPSVGTTTTWQPKGIQYSLSGESSSSKAAKSTIQWADGTGEIRGYHLADSFIGKQIKCYRVFRDYLTDGNNKITVFSGYISRVSWDYEWFTCEVAIGDTLRQKLPRRAYTTRCPWRPGGAECNADGNFIISTTPFLVSGTGITNSTGSTITDATLTQAANYWKWANLTITSGTNQIWKRKVSSFASGVLTLDYPVSVTEATTCSYSMTRGCDGSWDTCNGLAAWGPSADNSLNYGGFLHVNETDESY